MRARWTLAFAALLAVAIGVAKLVDAREATELVAEAREAARSDENARSAELFGEALDLDPGLRDTILREFADQLLYSGKAAEAIPLFRETLSDPGLSPVDAERARRSLALAYLWAGEHASAVIAYEEALGHLPGDADLTRNYLDALVGAAREAARNDRNHDAADFFARAIELAPDRRDGLLQEYADQLTYSGRAATAVGLYREIIATRFAGREPDRPLQSALGLALLWSDQPVAARKIFESLLAADPDDPHARRSLADALVALARREASSNHNAAAAALYEKAFVLVPEKRNELLKEYADQLTYSERTAEAIGRYSEMLSDFQLSAGARTEVRLSLALAQSWSGALTDALAEYDGLIAEDPSNLRARKGRAEILSWMERHDAAASELRRALALAPEDRELQRRLARAESYRGRHRTAVALARPLLAADPTDEEAAIIVADAERWMGRPDSALDTIETLLEAAPDSERALKLRGEILRDARPLTEVRALGSTQSDDLTIWSTSLRHGFTMNGGRTSFGPQYQHLGFEPESGRGVDVDRIGAFLHHRMSDAVELNSSFFVDFQRGANDETVFTHDSFLTIYPSDLWRVDIGASRYTLDNIKSLDLGITVDQFSGSVDFWPTGDIKLTGRGAWSDYSDGNERWWAQGEGVMRVLRGPDIWFGARYTAFAFEKELDNGYFNPDDLQSLESTFQMFGRLMDDLAFELRGAAGVEDADPADAKFIWSAALKLRYPLTDLVDAEALFGHSSSTLGSKSGFERTSIGLGLSVRW